MHRIHTDVNGKLYKREWTPGPKPHGYVKVLVNLPREHLEMMKIKNEQCGGLLPVNQQIRDAVRGQLCGLAYISPLNT